MSSVLGEHIYAAFAPPRFLAFPFSGIDVSASSVKAVRLSESVHGLVLAGHSEKYLPSGTYLDGEVVDSSAVSKVIVAAAEAAGISDANVALSESKSFLFETTVSGITPNEWRVEIEQHLDELIPLPPQEAVFDVVDVGKKGEKGTLVAGAGFAKRIVDETLSVFDQVGIRVRSLEGETFAMARALLPRGDNSTTLIIDIGKTTTKISIVEERIPRFATTIGIGGHSLTLAVQKHFGVTEEEARKIKVERGIVPAPGNDDYLATMLSTVSAIRDEIGVRLNYWQSKEARINNHEPVSAGILVGGNASVRGLPEYLEGALKIPITTGDVFSNLAPRDTWVPSLEYAESLAYTTAVGLALRDHVQSYA